MLDSGTLEISIEDELNVGGISFIDCQFTVFIPLKAITGASVVFRFTGRGAVPQAQFDIIAASLILCLIESLNDRTLGNTSSRVFGIVLPIFAGCNAIDQVKHSRKMGRVLIPCGERDLYYRSVAVCQ